MSPFGWISPSSQPRLFFVLTALLLVLSRALAAIGAPLVTPEAPRGIISFEFVRSADDAGRILGSWTPGAREQAMLSLGLDYLYLIVYPAWFALACLLLARRYGGGFGRLGAGLAWAVLGAGVFDAVENYALVQLVASGPSDAWARLASGCAAPKFALIFAAAAYVLSGGAWLVWKGLGAARGGSRS